MPDRDRFLQEGGTLRNRLGTTDPQALSSVESDLSLRRIQQLYAGNMPAATRGHFDLAHFKATHRQS